MDKKEIIPFILGLYVGFVLLSMYFSNPTSIEFVSVLIGFLAITLTISTLRTNKKHNIVSVKPILVFHLDQVEKFQFNLLSIGLGPALICCFKIKIDGQVLATNPSPINDPYIEIWKNLGIGGFEYEFHIPGKNSSYAIGAQRMLLSIKFTESEFIGKEELMNDYLEVLKKIEFEISYQSVYQNETFTEISIHDS
jgi:hypothetical protein